MSTAPHLRVAVVTLCPEMFPGHLGHTLAGRALDRGLWSLETVALRAFGIGRHRSVDDTPYGGGAGMVLRADVLGAAIDKAGEALPNARRIMLSPRGRVLDQRLVREVAQAGSLILVAGRFEGVDERVIAARGLEEVSVGDYVLSGGEPAALTLLDAVVRLLPGVMGDEASGTDESFEHGLLEYPHYTRPPVWEGMGVPDVLTSGDHGAVDAWRRTEAERLTRERRPDLLNANDTENAGSES